ncbi:hypothetical protein GCK32_014238, partial [Trichostrongylus colubriformis]
HSRKYSQLGSASKSVTVAEFQCACSRACGTSWPPKGMTGFGMPRDVKGKHLKRIWELEFPEEAITDQVPDQNSTAPVNAVNAQKK